MRNKLLVIAGVAALASFANADVVLDQISLNEGDNGSIWASQDFEASLNALDIGSIDDFTVNANQLNVTKVEAVMSLYFGGGALADTVWSTLTAFRVEIWSSLAAATSSLTGDVGSLTVAAGSASRTNLGFAGFPATSLIAINTNFNLPGAGTYYVGMIGVMPAGAGNNQVGVSENLVSSGGDNAHFVNPAGGWSEPGNRRNLQTDLSYRVNAVPEPGSMIALGLGATALLARRRRKAA